jgi:hypothetical protein
MYWVNDPVVINGGEGKVLSIDLRGRYTVVFKNGSILRDLKYAKTWRKESQEWDEFDPNGDGTVLLHFSLMAVTASMCHRSLPNSIIILCGVWKTLILIIKLC